MSIREGGALSIFCFSGESTGLAHYTLVVKVKGNWRLLLSFNFGCNHVFVFQLYCEITEISCFIVLFMIVVCFSATKHIRSTQKRGGASDFIQRGTPVPVSIKRVEVSIHQVQPKNKEMGTIAPNSSPREEFENYAVAPKVEVHKSSKNFVPKEITNVPLKSVDLNKGLDVATAIKRRAKNRVSSLEKAFASRDDKNIMSVTYLPLKEVYLKPDTATSKKQALRQQQDKTIRILEWLKDLKYLDEKAVQRGRQEVEKTQFKLPEIKEPEIAGYF